MTTDSQPPEPKTQDGKPKQEQSYYWKAILDKGKKLFDFSLNAIFYLAVDRIFRLVLHWLGVTEKTTEGHIALPIVRVLLIVNYVAYTIRTFAPEISQNLAEAYQKIKKDWRKPRRKKS